MSDVSHYLWLIPALPLLASVLITFLGYGLLRQHSHWPCILAAAGSFLCALMLLRYVQQHPEGSVSVYYTWFQIEGSFHVGVGLVADQLTAVMLTMVTFISTFIAVFSSGYMHDDEGYPRFFAEVSLFIASMCLLVLADNFLLLYAGWEGVGLCSYLLIGFWYQKPAAAAAARKAFLVTRLGDSCMMLGILMLWYYFGRDFTGGDRLVDSFSYKAIFGMAQEYTRADRYDPSLLYTACLLLFCGCAGKSAQFPFHVWLPDAMEGPTPVSALIHAATMVTAGVYLVARCTPIFRLVPEAQLIVACIGGFTALLAALIGLTQHDLKRVLAYSTLSQLGYMFLALGCAVSVAPPIRPGEPPSSGGGAEAGNGVVTLAVVAAIFHLFTHAFFKALLFLSAGSVMHAMGGIIDMRRFSGLRKLMPLTHFGFLCGALALAGVPVFSGFWSKDEILGAALDASSASDRFGTIYFLLLLVGVFTAGLTGFYTFRAYFLTFWGKEKIPHEAGHHAHESPPVMTMPLLVLSAFALLVGLVLGPTGLFVGFLEKTPGWPHPGHEGMHPGLMVISSVVALAGVGLAWLMYVQKPLLSYALTEKARALYQLSLDKFHFDELYEAFLVRPMEVLAGLSGYLDLKMIDRLVDLIGGTPRLVGGLFRYVQNGLVQFYALAMVLGLTVFILALLRSLP